MPTTAQRHKAPLTAAVTSMSLEWWTWSIVAVLGWGVWSILAKIASSSASWQQVFVFSYMGTFVVIAAIFLYYMPPLNITEQGPRVAIVSGMLSGVAVLAFYLALQGGKASLVVPTTSLYPVVTVVLSFVFLQEKVSLSQGAGVALALVAIFLMSRG